MTDPRAFIRLQTLLSPAFPTGAFSYSCGLEAAIDDGLIATRQELRCWLVAFLKQGQGWNDAVLLSESWRLTKGGDDVSSVAELAKAMSFSAERYLESTAQGAAFLKASTAWLREIDLMADSPLPVAVGRVAARLDIALVMTLNAYLHASISNQIQAALRLFKLGQQGGVALLVDLETIILETSEAASSTSLEDLGTSTLIADISAMRHETMGSRIFRS